MQINGWSLKEERHFTEDEIGAVISSRVFQDTHNLSVEFTMSDNSTLDFPLDDDAVISVDDSFDIYDSYVRIWQKEGEENDIRIMVYPDGHEVREVKDLLLEDGALYSGPTIKYYGKWVPSGMGIAKYQDHKVLGNFSLGVQSGVAYLNYHDWMWAGECLHGQINGWGIYINKGNCKYGIFEKGLLKIDITNLIQIVWNKIVETARFFDFNMIRVLKDKREIFIGYPESYSHRKMGFHFTESENDYIGVHDFEKSNEITGSFIQINKNFGIITLGQFINGSLVRKIDKIEYVSECELWSSHEFNDFDISEMYSVSGYGLSSIQFYDIKEIGNIPGFIVVQAEILKAYKSIFERTGKIVWFKFADKQNIQQELIDIFNSSYPWVPNGKDYRIEFVNNIRESGTSHLPMRVHESCYSEKYFFKLNIINQIDFSSLFDEDSGDELPF